tara:strand:+ start:150 stop:584 length:435 start_codon:yes stop_codon:yes gene_type:complete
MSPKERRKSRVLAVQLAYGCELSGNSAENLLENCFSGKNAQSKNIRKYSLNLLKHTHKNIDKIDKIIGDNSKNWELNRIALTDKLVLRLAISEMMHVKDVPGKVSISEAVEISKVFGTKDSGPFVNGILDAIFKRINKGEYILN